MKIALSKSSLLAAIEISKDKEILNIKNLNYLESIKNSFDMKNGHELIKLIGSEKIKELSEKNKLGNYQLILREILIKYLKNWIAMFGFGKGIQIIIHWIVMPRILVDLFRTIDKWCLLAKSFQGLTFFEFTIQCVVHST